MIGIPELSPAIARKWDELLNYQRQMRACKRLQRITDAKANSFEVIDFRKRREAALKHTRRTA